MGQRKVSPLRLAVSLTKLKPLERRQIKGGPRVSAWPGTGTRGAGKPLPFFDWLRLRPGQTCISASHDLPIMWQGLLSKAYLFAPRRA